MDAVLAHEVLSKKQLLFEMSTLLNTGLDEATLDILVKLCEMGVNPEALAAVVEELRAKAADLEAEISRGTCK